MVRGPRSGSCLPSNIQRRGLTAEQAADYCGCETLAALATWVKRGIIPGPIPGTQRYDRRAIDAALDRASGLAKDRTSSFEEWASANAD